MSLPWNNYPAAALPRYVIELFVMLRSEIETIERLLFSPGRVNYIKTEAPSPAGPT